jgi:hypothetical protein
LRWIPAGGSSRPCPSVHFEVRMRADGIVD